MKKWASLSTIALLTSHQADASFQKEWLLFGVPGGINFFLLFNTIAIALLLIAFRNLNQSPAISEFWRYLIPATGLFTVLLHLILIVMGNPEFTQPASVTILGLLTITSLADFFYSSKKA